MTVLAPLVAVALLQTEVPQATREHGAFAFADAHGSRLIVTAELPEPERFTAALCGARRVAVTFERRQPRGPARDGRQTPDAFDTLEGQVFRAAGKLAPGQTCLVTRDAFLETASLARISAPPSGFRCTPDARRHIIATRRRMAANCWSLGSIGPDMPVSLVEFVRQGKEALASIVLEVHTRLFFADYTAEYRGPGEDLWRAEDEGVLRPDGISVLFALRNGDAYVLGVEWSGFEGDLVTLMVTEGDDRFVEVLQQYWYRAPR